MLQQHNNYLGKLIKSNNLLYQLDYILTRTGNESRSIIRGDAKFITIDEDNFHYSNETLLVKLVFFKENEGGLLYVNPSIDIINNHDLYKYDLFKNDIYASSNCFYVFFRIV